MAKQLNRFNINNNIIMHKCAGDKDWWKNDNNPNDDDEAVLRPKMGWFSHHSNGQRTTQTTNNK